MRTTHLLLLTLFKPHAWCQLLLDMSKVQQCPYISHELRATRAQEQLQCRTHQKLPFQQAYRHTTMPWLRSKPEDAFANCTFLVSNDHAQCAANDELQVHYQSHIACQKEKIFLHQEASLTVCTRNISRPCEPTKCWLLQVPSFRCIHTGQLLDPCILLIRLLAL